MELCIKSSKQMLEESGQVTERTHDSELTPTVVRQQPDMTAEEQYNLAFTIKLYRRAKGQRERYILA